MQSITYRKDLDIRNLESLPRGLNCQYLEVIESHIPGTYIAKQWRRNIAAFEYANMDNDDAIIIEFQS